LREAVVRLIESKRLTKREAGNVLSLDVPLEKLLVRKEVGQVLRRRRFRSCLTDAYYAHEAISIHLLHGGGAAGSVLGVTKYDVAFEPSSQKSKTSPVFMIDKLLIKYSHDPACDSAVSASRTIDTRIKVMDLRVPAKVKDRFHLRSEDLQRYLRDSTPLKFTTFDGDVFKGTIQWWSQHEIRLDVGKGVAVTLFRHAIHGYSEADGSNALSWGGAVRQDPEEAPKAPEDPEAPVYDPTKDMTRTQAEVWRTIENLERPWTITDIAGKCGRSRGSVNNAVNLFVDAEMVREASRQGRKRYFIVEPEPGGDED